MLLSPTPSLHGYTVCIPGGMAGVHTTLRTMRQLVNAGKIDLALRQATLGLIFTLPPKNENSEITAIFNFVRDQIRYVRDIVGIETISTPIKVLQQRAGDCDDKTVLLAAMLETIGYPTRFVVAGYHTAGEVEHVYLQVWTQAGWIDLDATENYEAGCAPPEPVTIFTENV